MPITPFLRDRVFDTETIELMDSVYVQLCASLGLDSRNDALNEIVAERIIELAQSGIRTRTALYMRTLLDFKSNPQ